MLEEYLERLRAVYGLGLFSLLAAGAAETVGRAAAGGQQAESGFVSGGRRSADGYEQDAAREVSEKFGGGVGEDLIKRGGWSELPAAAAEDAAAGWFTAAGGGAGRWRTAEEQLSAAGGRFFGAAGGFENLHIDYNQYNELNAAEAGSAVRGGVLPAAVGRVVLEKSPDGDAGGGYRPAGAAEGGLSAGGRRLFAEDGAVFGGSVEAIAEAVFARLERRLALERAVSAEGRYW